MEWQAIKTGRIPVPSLKTTSAGPPNPANQSPGSTTGSTQAASSLPSAELKPESDQPGAPPSQAASGSENKPSNSAASAAAASENTDQSETQVAESRLSKEAEQRRADETKNHAGKNDAKDQEDEADANAKSAPETKPVSATKPPDPRQNKLLISGEKYLYGRGVPRSCQQALTYFRAAADDDNAPAMSHLGAMYASGHCVAMNRTMAYKWFARASETDPRNQWTQRNLNMLWRDMTPQERAAVSNR
jgi:TPR repeat protein